MKISSYADRGTVILRLSKTRIEQNNKIGIYSDHHFTSDIIVMTRYSKYSKTLGYVSFYCPKKNVIFSINIPEDFQCTLVRGKQCESIMNQFHNYAVKNLSSAMPYGKPRIGSDPEIFAIKKDGAVLPAFEFLPSKDKPLVVDHTSHINFKNSIYWDGYQAEFDTKAEMCLGWHTDSVQAGLKGVYEAAIKHDKDATLSFKPTLDIPIESLETAKDEHVQFGCMPSFNAYGMEGIKENGRAVPFRSAGGHIHFGLEKGAPKKEVAERMVKALDAILGVACVSLFVGYDEPRRRMMYGLAGEYRLPKHGIEYRTLSNAWLMHPLLMNVVFDLARAALKVGEQNLLSLWNCKEEDTIRIINTCNVEDARKVLSQNETMFKQILAFGYSIRNSNDAKVAGAHALFMEGIDSHIKDPTNIVKNWNLNGKWVTHSGAPGNSMESAVQEIVFKKTKVA